MDGKISSIGLTFDDVLLQPSYSDFRRDDIDLSTNLTSKIKLKVPFVSSPMDTVTEFRLAVELGKLGGIGIIHRNLSVKDQTTQVEKVIKEGYLVGAAVGASAGYEDRVSSLVNVGVDVIVVDSAHGHARPVIEAVQFIKNKYDVEVIAGNIATEEAAIDLINSGADALRVGMGPGAICTTRVISGMGVPQVTALSEVRKGVLKSGKNVPILADGGIKYSGDMVKALAVGASVVMMGSFFASTEESPGETVELKQEEVPDRFRSIFEKKKKYLFKTYRGMGSVGAMKEGSKIKSEDEYHGKSYKDRVLVAEGVEGYVPVRGTVQELVDQAIGGVKSGMYYVGARSIKDLWKNSKFIKITQASLTESHPHSLLITNPGENY